VPDQQAWERRLEESRGIDLAARVEIVAATAVFSVFQAVERIGPRAPDAGIGGSALIGNVGPDYRQALVTCQVGDVVDVLDLARVAFIGRLKFVDFSIGILEIDIDDR
jgi:hypothetical protein